MKDPCPAAKGALPFGAGRRGGVALAVPALSAASGTLPAQTAEADAAEPRAHATAWPKTTPTPLTRNRTARSASEAAYQKPQGQHAPALFARPRAALRV